MKTLILQQCNAISKPVIAIDCNIDNAYKINFATYEAQKVLIEHLIKHHDCRKINYISGPLENDDSRIRLKAYLQYGMIAIAT